MPIRDRSMSHTSPRNFHNGTFTQNLPGDQEGIRIGDILPKGRYFRHPDSATISYVKVVEAGPLGEFDKNKELDIAIVGAGAAGVTVLYELSRIIDAGKCGKITVTLYDSDPEHFSYDHPTLSPFKRNSETPSLSIPSRMLKLSGKKAGRLFAARSYHEEQSHAVYEIGAMRFPALSGLLWHYAEVLFGADAKVKEFPNPDQQSPVKKAVNILQRGLIGNVWPEPNVAIFKIGGKDPAKITEELKSPKTSQARLEQILEEWKEFIEEYDSITLGAAVRLIMTSKIDELPPVSGLIGRQALINYYYELIGVFGFGTGSFRPLFGCGFVEIMRLFLWSYSNEYLLPVKENYQLIEMLFQECLQVSYKNEDFQICFRHEKVTDVCHNCETGQAMVFSIPSSRKDCGENGCSSNGICSSESPKPTEGKRYDYVILATTPQQLTSMISRTGYSNEAHPVLFGNYGQQYSEPVMAKNPFILSKENETANTQMYTAIRNINMVNSSKIFATIRKSVYDKWAPKIKFQNDDKELQIRAFVTDTGLGSGYAIDSNVHQDYISFLISYNWESDTKRLQHHFRVLPTNALNLKTSTSARRATAEEHELMLNDIINYTERDVREPNKNGNYKRWWLAEMLTDKADGKSVLLDTLSYDWNTSPAGGAFKQDLPGSSYNSNLCFRFHTHALNKDLDNRFFLAGCSYSHLGGWIEGAFMTAINAVAGLIVAANGGGKVGLSKLSPEARMVIEAYEPIAPIKPYQNGHSSKI